MNIYLCIIVAALLIEYFLNTLAKILDLKNLSTDLPSEFRDYYSQEEYTRSQEYLKANTNFSYLQVNLLEKMLTSLDFSSKFT